MLKRRHAVFDICDILAHHRELALNSFQSFEHQFACYVLGHFIASIGFIARAGAYCIQVK